jgi:hypothetical protein
MGRKAIFAGDHKQLPPTVKSKEAASKGFGKTLFEELADRCEASCKLKLIKDPNLITLLKTQYRMNEAIMEVASSYIYGGELIADSTVKDHNLSDIARPDENEEGVIENGQTALIWIDTAGAGFGDCEEDKGTAADGSKVLLPAVLQTASKFNEGECELVSILYKDLRLRQKLGIGDIGVIAPYKAQVDLIRNALTHYEQGETRCEVSTVDGFQGREKEVIILSLTRSNPVKEIGFLSDVRRLNVAITRPKRLLIIVGDSDTVTKNQFINAIYQKVRERGQIMSVYDLQNNLKTIEGEDGEELRKFYNTGTFLTQAHLKVKEIEPKMEADIADNKKKDQNKKRKKSTLTEKPGDKKAEDELEAAKLKKEAELLNLFNNPYSIDNDLFDKLQDLVKNPSNETIKIFRKLDQNEFRGLEAFLETKPDLVLKTVKKPKSLTINHKSPVIEISQDEEVIEEESAEEDPEVARLEREKEEERVRKLKEKKQRQKEAKQKKKEEEQAIAEMDDDAYFEMLEKQKEQRLADQKFCQVMLGSTGKRCLKNIQLLGLVCKYCENKFCTAHAFASMHGCEDAEQLAYDRQRNDLIKGRQIGSSGDDPKHEAASAYLQAKLRRMREEEEAKRKPKTKEEAENEKEKGKKTPATAAGRGGRGGRGGKKPSAK